LKKLLYKQKPTAKFDYIRKGIVYYNTSLQIEHETVDQYLNIVFEIPVVDMGDADFTRDMDAKLLIRWILTE
jgi:hypothetical protein